MNSKQKENREMSSIEIVFLILIIGSLIGIGWQLLTRKR
jgi:hypothetical protein